MTRNAGYGTGGSPFKPPSRRPALHRLVPVSPVAYTLFGSSRQLIVGPEGSIAALVATALIPVAADDPGRYASLAALLALLVGACFLVARVVRLGWVADYFSRAVLIGYLHVVAVVLAIGSLVSSIARSAVRVVNA